MIYSSATFSGYSPPAGDIVAGVIRIIYNNRVCLKLSIDFCGKPLHLIATHTRSERYRDRAATCCVGDRRESSLSSRAIRSSLIVITARFFRSAWLYAFWPGCKRRFRDSNKF